MSDDELTNLEDASVIELEEMKSRALRNSRIWLERVLMPGADADEHVGGYPVRAAAEVVPSDLEPHLIAKLVIERPDILFVHDADRPPLLSAVKEALGILIYEEIRPALFRQAIEHGAVVSDHELSSLRADDRIALEEMRSKLATSPVRLG